MRPERFQTCEKFTPDPTRLPETGAGAVGGVPEGLPDGAGNPHPGPRKRLVQMLQGYIQPQLIYVAARLGLADLLQDGPQTFEMLAAELDVAPPAFRRVLNGLVSIGILQQPSGQTEAFGLTTLGECLVSDRPGSLREVAIFQGEELYAAWGQLLHSVRTGQPAFRQVLGSEFFDYLGNFPQVGNRFHSFITNTGNHAGKAFCKAYDFSGVETVMDIGGGTGGLLTEVLESYPHLQGLLFDIADQFGVEEEKPGLPEIWQRCTSVRGDFFHEIPLAASNAAIVLSQILHDWDDERAVKILTNCRRAVGTSRNVRLLLFENLLPGEDQEKCAPSLVEQDLVMLVLTGGRERTVKEFEELLEASGWKPGRVIPTRHSRSILEAWPI